MIELIFAFFALYGMLSSIIQLKRDIITIHQFIFWMIIWIGLAVLSVGINIVGRYIVALGVSRPIDLFMSVAIIVLLMMLFQTKVQQEKINRQITELVRQDAIRNAKKK